MNGKNRLRRELAHLRELREELRLQAHLGGLETRNLWLELDECFDELRAEILERGTASLGAAEARIYETLHDLRDEFEQLRETIKRSASSRGRPRRGEPSRVYHHAG